MMPPQSASAAAMSLVLRGSDILLKFHSLQ